MAVRALCVEKGNESGWRNNDLSLLVNVWAEVDVWVATAKQFLQFVGMFLVSCLNDTFHLYNQQHVALSESTMYTHYLFTLTFHPHIEVTSVLQVFTTQCCQRSTTTPCLTAEISADVKCALEKYSRHTYYGNIMTI